MEKSIDRIVTDKIQRIKERENVYHVGRVREIHDYIIEVTGLEDAGYFERVVIGDKAEGYVNSIGRNAIKVALTRLRAPVCVGDEVAATGEEFAAEFSPDSTGHVVDMFGEDKLVGRKFDRVERVLIDTPPIPIMDRTSVCRPMLTGVTGIDLLYPIGCGQRQLIIGDKKTGKTQIALDTIVNQRDFNRLCIYIAVGKTKKEVKEVYSQLLAQGAMGYTIILAAFNDECPPVLQNTPYAGLALAEKYMLRGTDVLVVIDDLKKHADVYREISLLSGSVPGRDAYPPDIFYAHARLLERGCQHKCGGSITILPICETKGGDISEYISTNIISITDGQIVLSARNFEKGQKPAIDYGLSVSRLGGAVQTAAVKRVGARIRRELLSYLETRAVFELANADDMNDNLKQQMQRGREMLDKLRQGRFDPQPLKTILRNFEKLAQTR